MPVRVWRQEWPPDRGQAAWEPESCSSRGQGRGAHGPALGASDERERQSGAKVPRSPSAAPAGASAGTVKSPRAEGRDLACRLAAISPRSADDRDCCPTLPGPRWAHAAPCSLPQSAVCADRLISWARAAAAADPSPPHRQRPPSAGGSDPPHQSAAGSRTGSRPQPIRLTAPTGSVYSTISPSPARRGGRARSVKGTTGQEYRMPDGRRSGRPTGTE